jgi:hypothetical protein
MARTASYVTGKCARGRCTNREVDTHRVWDDTGCQREPRWHPKSSELGPNSDVQDRNARGDLANANAPKSHLVSSRSYFPVLCRAITE